MMVPGAILGQLPPPLRDELVGCLQTIERNFREGRWEPSELNGGKLCEVAYSILKGHVDGAYPAKATKPPNMVDACKALETSGKAFPRAIAIQIPRMIVALYEVRNNRGVGHVGGDVSPSHMDAVCVLHMCKWIVSELVRVFHNVSTEEAARTVDALSEREIALVWNVNGVRRVLQNQLSMLKKTLVLLYSSPQPLSETDLVRFLEHSNPSVYRRDILRVAHKKRLIEYDEVSKLVELSPTGSRLVETDILDRTAQ